VNSLTGIDASAGFSVADTIADGPASARVRHVADHRKNSGRHGRFPNVRFVETISDMDRIAAAQPTASSLDQS
jgi:hypothetical protein